MCVYKYTKVRINLPLTLNPEIPTISGLRKTKPQGFAIKLIIRVLQSENDHRIS